MTDLSPRITNANAWNAGAVINITSLSFATTPVPYITTFSLWVSVPNSAADSSDGSASLPVFMPFKTVRVPPNSTAVVFSQSGTAPSSAWDWTLPAGTGSVNYFPWLSGSYGPTYTYDESQVRGPPARSSRARSSRARSSRARSPQLSLCTKPGCRSNCSYYFHPPARLVREWFATESPPSPPVYLLRAPHSAVIHNPTSRRWVDWRGG